MKNSGRILVINAIIICLFTGKAIAQIGNPGIMYQGAFNNAMFLTTKSAIERGLKSSSKSNLKKGTPLVTSTSNLNFISSTKVHDKVLELIATIAANGDKHKIKSAAETIKNANFMGQFEHLLQPYGFSRHNMPDVFTAFIILSWQAINGEDVGQYREGIKVFRKQIHEAMDYNNKLSEFTNNQKQEISEILSYMAIFFTYVNQDQLKKGNTASLAATRQNIRQAVIRVSGIDLTKYTFNNKGLSEK